MAPASPTVAQRELALRLRGRRRQLGLEVKHISERFGFTRNYWSLIENERAILTESKLESLADLFKFDDRELQELVELRRRAREPNLWAAYSHLFDEELIRFYGLESGAQSIRNYEGILVAGLLQTEEYARAVIKAHPTISQVSVEERVLIRMQRQERLTGSDPLLLTAVMSQAALMQQIGGVDILRRQLLHLAATFETLPEPSEIRILPFTANPGGMTGASTLYLLDFSSTNLPTVAWQESSRTMSVNADPDNLQELEVSFSQALEASLNRVDSLDLIKRTAEGLQ